MSLSTIRSSALTNSSGHNRLYNPIGNNNSMTATTEGHEDQVSVSSTDVNVDTGLIDRRTKFDSSIYYSAREDSFLKDSEHSLSSGDDSSGFPIDEEKKDDTTIPSDVDGGSGGGGGAGPGGLTRQRSTRSIGNVEHHPWKKKSIRDTFGGGGGGGSSPSRRIRGVFSFPKDEDETLRQIPVSPGVSVGSAAADEMPVSPKSISLLPVMPTTDEQSLSNSSHHLRKSLEGRSPLCTSYAKDKEDSSTQDLSESDDSLSQRGSPGRHIWRRDLSTRSMKQDLSPVGEQATLSSEDLALRRKVSSSVEDEWRTLLQEAAIEPDEDSPPNSNGPSELCREDSYVKRIVKNVEEHGSPTPGLRKVIPTVPRVEVQEGKVQTIKEDVETWAKRSPQYDKKGNLIINIDEGYVRAVKEDVETWATRMPQYDKKGNLIIDIDEGHVKTVVHDVEKRVTPTSKSGDEQHDNIFYLVSNEAHDIDDEQKSDIPGQTLDKDSMRVASIEQIANSDSQAGDSSQLSRPQTSTDVTSKDDNIDVSNIEEHKHATPKTKNTEATTPVAEQDDNAGSAPVVVVRRKPMRNDPLVEELKRFQRQHMGSSEHSPSSSQRDDDVPDTVEATPLLNSRDVLPHRECSFSTPPPPFHPTHQIPTIHDTPLSVAKSVSFEDAGSVKSDLGSMVSNLSYPTNSGGSYMASGPHYSPRMSTSSSGVSTGTPRSTGSKTRKRISEMIRRDLWSKDENVVEEALVELAEKAGLASQNRHAIARSGGILAIVRAMEQNDTHAGIQVAACQALEKLALETENELAIGEVGGVDAVLAAMMQHVGNARVQEAAWSSLWNLTCGNACDEMTTDTEGGMHAIVACMKQHVDHPEVQRNACGALTNLCLHHDGRLRSLAEADGFVAIAAALQNHWDNESVRKEASNALAALLEKSLPYSRNNGPSGDEDDDDDETICDEEDVLDYDDGSMLQLVNE